MEPPSPSNLHLKPFIACAALIVFALGYSWAVPFVHVSCLRNGERVECRVQRRLFGLIPYQTTEIADLQRARLRVEQGTRESGRNETTDTAYLLLIDAEGVEMSIMLESAREMGMARAEAFTERIETFLGSDEPAFTDWTAPLIGYGAIVPAVLGVAFLALVTWNFVGTQFRGAAN